MAARPPLVPRIDLETGTQPVAVPGGAVAAASHVHRPLSAVDSSLVSFGHTLDAASSARSYINEQANSTLLTGTAKVGTAKGLQRRSWVAATARPRPSCRGAQNSDGMSS